MHVQLLTMLSILEGKIWFSINQRRFNVNDVEKLCQRLKCQLIVASDPEFVTLVMLHEFLLLYTATSFAPAAPLSSFTSSTLSNAPLPYNQLAQPPFAASFFHCHTDEESHVLYIFCSDLVDWTWLLMHVIIIKIHLSYPSFTTMCYRFINLHFMQFYQLLTTTRPAMFEKTHICDTDSFIKNVYLS